METLGFGVQEMNKSVTLVFIVHPKSQKDSAMPLLNDFYNFVWYQFSLYMILIKLFYLCFRNNSATGKSSSVSFDDPFGILESTSTTTKHNIAGDPLDEFDIFNRSGNQKPSKTSNDTPSIKPPPKPGQVLKADKGLPSYLQVESPSIVKALFIILLCQGAVKTSGVALIDELDIFSMGGARNDSGKVPRERQNGKTSKYREAESAARKPQQKNADDLLSSSVSSRSSSVPKSRAPTSVRTVNA